MIHFNFSWHYLVYEFVVQGKQNIIVQWQTVSALPKTVANRYRYKCSLAVQNWRGFSQITHLKQVSFYLISSSTKTCISMTGTCTFQTKEHQLAILLIGKEHVIRIKERRRSIECMILREVHVCNNSEVIKVKVNNNLLKLYYKHLRSR